MECYSSFEEKSTSFASCEVVNTHPEFMASIAQIKEKMDKRSERWAFRGICEAKFKLYTSLQREWLTSDLARSGQTPQRYVSLMLEHLRKPENKLIQYLDALNVHTNDWLLLAFLQHYGAPSPLLDFTRDYIPALFFMCRGMQRAYSKNEIDHYASLVFYKTQGVCEQGIEKLGSTAWRKKEELSPSLNSEDDRRAFVDKHLSFQKIMSGSRMVEILTSDNGRTQVKKANQPVAMSFPIANMNMVSQNGEFVCNVTPDTPLEQLFITTKAQKPLIHCINFHKSLLEGIVNDCLDSSLTAKQTQLFPSEEFIATQARHYARNNLTRL